MTVERHLLAGALAIGVAASAMACRNTSGRGGSSTDAVAFLAEANGTILRLGNDAQQTSWVQSTYITPDTEAIAARANEAYMSSITSFAKRATQFDTVNVSDEQRRELTVLKNSLTVAAPSDQKTAAELA